MKILMVADWEWSTQINDEDVDARIFVLTCPYLIEALGKGEKITAGIENTGIYDKIIDKLHPAVMKFILELESKYGYGRYEICPDKIFSVNFIDRLIVVNVNGPFYVDVDYESCEFILERDKIAWLDII